MSSNVPLYTGITSRSRSAVPSLRTTTNKSNVAKRQLLKPHAQVVFDEIEKLKEEDLDLKTIILEGKTTEDVRFDLAVRKHSYHRLSQLQTRLNTILKAEEKEQYDQLV